MGDSKGALGVVSSIGIILDTAYRHGIPLPTQCVTPLVSIPMALDIVTCYYAFMGASIACNLILT